MQFWEFLLEADQRLDLADETNALSWLRARPWTAGTEPSWWTERARANWKPSLLALRSLARRLKKKRLRRPAPDGLANDLDADRIAYDLVGLLRVQVQIRPVAGAMGLSGKTYAGLRVVPSATVGDGSRTAVFPDPTQFWRDDLGFYWQFVFFTLLSESGPAVCERCGEALGETTPTGRPKKQKLCKRCSWQAWWAKQSTKKKRAKWRQDYEQRKGRE